MYGIFLCHTFWDVCNYTKLTTTLVVTYQSVIPMQELNLLRGRREQTQSAKHEEVNDSHEHGQHEYQQARLWTHWLFSKPPTWELNMTYATLLPVRVMQQTLAQHIPSHRQSNSDKNANTQGLQMHSEQHIQTRPRARTCLHARYYKREPEPTQIIHIISFRRVLTFKSEARRSDAAWSALQVFLV